jgi:ribosome-associated protein
VRAIYEEISRAAKAEDLKIRHYEYDESSRWILVDFFDIILHIFLDEARGFYNLEYLWHAAKKIKITQNSHEL